MSTIEKSAFWIYNYIISLILSFVFIITVLIENFLEIFVGSKITSLMDFNINLIRQISKINLFTSFDQTFKTNDQNLFTADPEFLYKNFLAVFILIIFFPIFFVTVLIFVILNLILRSEKIDQFIDNLIIESDKLLLKLIGYKTQGNFYYANFNIFYFMVISVPLYYVLSRPAFYGDSIFSLVLGSNLGSILGNASGAILMGLYFLFIFPHFFGPIFHGSKNSFVEDIGIKKITVSEILIALFVIVIFITILAGTYTYFIPSAQETYDFSNLLPFLSYALIAGILEETYFRGIVLNFLLVNSKKNRVAIPIILSAVTFSAAHSVNIFYGSTFTLLTFQMYITFLFGLLVGIIYYKTKSLWPGIIIHTLIDAYSFGFNNTYSGVVTLSDSLMIEIVGWTLAIGLMIIFSVLIIELKKSLDKPNVI